MCLREEGGCEVEDGVEEVIEEEEEMGLTKKDDENQQTSEMIHSRYSSNCTRILYCVINSSCFRVFFMSAYLLS